MTDGVKKHYTDVGCPKGYSWQIQEISVGFAEQGFQATIWKWIDGKPQQYAQAWWFYRASCVSWLRNEFMIIKAQQAEKLAPNY